MGHGDVGLGGPVWFFAQFLILAAIVLSIFVLFDSLRASRRASAAERLPEPLWVYTVSVVAFLVLIIAVQVIPGIQLGAAAVAIAAPIVAVLGMVYLLRVVFPKQPDSSEPSEAAEKPADPE